MDELNNQLNGLNNDYRNYNQNKNNIVDALSLNNSLDKINKEYNNHIELINLKNNIQNDSSKNIINNRMNNLKRIENNNQNNIVYDRNTPVNTVSNFTNNNLINQYQFTNHINTNQNNHQNQQNQSNQNNQKNQDYRNSMNEKMNEFRFSNNYINRSLVPVNMEHVYSGNIFDENPIPFDMLHGNKNFNNEYNQTDQFSQLNNVHYLNSNKNISKRFIHQEKSKLMYKNEANDRLNELNPMGKTLYYPINEGFNANKQANLNRLPVSSHNISLKSKMKDEVNDKISNYTPLMTNVNMSTNNQNVGNTNTQNNNNIEKIKYQDFLPVSSK